MHHGANDVPAVAILRSLVVDGALPEYARVESPDVFTIELDEKSRALVVVAAVIATGGGTSSYRRCVDAAITAGASAEEVVDVLVAVAPTVGLTVLAPATTELAAALGYDIDHALETLDAPTPPPA